MTLVFDKPKPAPATHAFVIGVGSYPACKAGQGQLPELRRVPDVPSAADSARLMCDWLIANEHSLAAPLASIELLITDAPHGALSPYPWQNSQPVADATAANVAAAGQAWVKRVSARPGDRALFYACSHGARRAANPVLLLSDLNTDPIDPWSAHLDLGATALSFKQLAGIDSAVFLLDACQEASVRFELAQTRSAAAFIRPYDVFALDRSRENVWLLSGASDGKLAYDGPWTVDPAVRIGRFTQTVQLALDGALARPRPFGPWVVHSSSIADDIKPLHRLRPDFNDRAFEPSQHISPNQPIALTRHPNPRIPVLVLTDPDSEMSNFDVGIWSDHARTNALAQRTRAREAWLAWIPASHAPHVVAAYQAPSVLHATEMYPYCAIFDQRIPVR